jgi:hypothetical protein
VCTPPPPPAPGPSRAEQPLPNSCESAHLASPLTRHGSLPPRRVEAETPRRRHDRIWLTPHQRANSVTQHLVPCCAGRFGSCAMVEGPTAPDPLPSLRTRRLAGAAVSRVPCSGSTPPRVAPTTAQKHRQSVLRTALIGLASACAGFGGAPDLLAFTWSLVRRAGPPRRPQPSSGRRAAPAPPDAASSGAHLVRASRPARAGVRRAARWRASPRSSPTATSSNR